MTLHFIVNGAFVVLKCFNIIIIMNTFSKQTPKLIHHLELKKSQTISYTVHTKHQKKTEKKKKVANLSACR